MVATEKVEQVSLSGERRSYESIDFLLSQLSYQISDIRRRLENHILEEDHKFDQILNEVHSSHRTIASLMPKVPCITEKGKTTLWVLLNSDLTAVKFVTFFYYVLSSVSVYFYQLQDPVGNLHFLVGLAPTFIWTFLFGIMAIWRLIEIFMSSSNKFFRILMPTLGLWLWGLTFMSSAVFTPIDDLECLVIVPILVEVWILSRTFKKERIKVWTR